MVNETMSTAEKLASALEALDACYCEASDEMSRAQRAHHRKVLIEAREVLAEYRAQPAADGAQRVRPESSFPMGDGWAVTVSRWNEHLLTISSEHLAGKSNLTDEDERVILGCSEHLAAFLGAPAREAQRVDQSLREHVLGLFDAYADATAEGAWDADSQQSAERIIESLTLELRGHGVGAQRVDRMSEERIEEALNAGGIGHHRGENIVGRPWWLTSGSVPVVKVFRAIETHLAAAWGVKPDGEGGNG